MPCQETALRLLKQRRCKPIQGKSTGYKPLPITPRNTDATWRFIFRSRLLAAISTAPCCSKSSVRFQFSEPHEIHLTVQSDGRSVQAIATEPEQVGSRQSRERPSGVAPGRPFEPWHALSRHIPAAAQYPNQRRRAIIFRSVALCVWRGRSRTKRPRLAGCKGRGRWAAGVL